MKKQFALPGAELAGDMSSYVELVREFSDRFYEGTGRPPNAFTHHYGCQQNVADGEKIDGLLSQMGYVFVPCEEEADFVLYNTCAVREGAEDRIYGNVGALKHAKKRNPHMIIALCGCMMQQEYVAQRIRRSFPHVDLVFGSNAMHLLPQLLYRRLSEGKRVFSLEQNDDIVEGLPSRREGGIKAWLPIMHGCDNFCTYCVVPLVRGRERSRRPEDILEEARALIGQGFKELTLLGQNVNSYGKGLEHPVSFSELLRRINEIPGDFRIRFTTSHPKDCTRELIDTIAGCHKICNHLHLPVQCGSNRILGLMNRKYTREQYRELICYARERVPGITFTSDIMVGFPGETREDFQQTLDLVREVRYQSLFTFLYSKRSGTKAADMEDPVSREEKLRWFNELLDAQNTIGGEHHSALVGRTIRVLADGPGKTAEGMIAGRSESNVIVEFPADPQIIGKFTDVTVTEALRWAVLGERTQGK